MKNLAELVGKRILLRQSDDWYYGLRTIREAKIKELSPSKDYINLSGKWWRVKDVAIIEVLN